MIDIKDYDEDYYKLTTSYSNIINNTVSFFDSLNIYNTNEKFFLYCILLRKGFFSNANDFAAEEPPYSNSSSINDGMQIMTGHGVCRHMTDLYKSIMTKSGKNFGLLYLYGDSKPNGIITRADHVVAISKDDIRVLMYDSMKAAVFELLSGLDIFSYIDDTAVSFPDISFTLLCQIQKQQLQDQVKYINNPLYTKDQMKYFLEQVKTVYKNSPSMFEDFRQLNHDNIKNVSHLVLKYKNNKSK